MAEEIVVPSNDDKNIATVTHLAGTIFTFFPALIVWVWKKNENAFIADQAKEALNFQITVALTCFILGAIPFIGWIIAGPIWLINIICCVLAGLGTSKGETYRYPFCLRLIS